ncbi:MAG: DUF1501 domain-containing protein, partial [Planctomycetaceae bacterium]|nr:DUF1501 domain-containing protein [Planctomycetaceae bacterium]
MFTVPGQRALFCDGVSRRSFLKAGFLGGVGLSLTDVLRLRSLGAESSPNRPNTAVIFVELAGGPTQFETYDPKPDAPAEFRGPLGVVQTSIPGEVFSELMPEQARIADQLVIIRSIHHSSNSHDPSSHLSQTGYYKSTAKGAPNQMPCFGSVVAKLRGANLPSLPAYVAIPNVMRNGRSAYLGPAWNPFETTTDPNRKDFDIPNLKPSAKVTLDRLEDRRTLLSAFDAQRRFNDLQGDADAIDEFSQRAFELVHGSRAREAFDISREDPKLRDRYGRNTVGQSLLLARRLVEAGV